jgi:hypothetical protein
VALVTTTYVARVPPCPAMTRSGMTMLTGDQFEVISTG